MHYTGPSAEPLLEWEPGRVSLCTCRKLITGWAVEPKGRPKSLTWLLAEVGGDGKGGHRVP